MNIKRNDFGTYANCILLIRENAHQFLDGFKPFFSKESESFMDLWNGTGNDQKFKFDVSDKVDVLIGNRMRRNGRSVEMKQLISPDIGYSLLPGESPALLSKMLDEVKEVCIKCDLGKFIMIKNKKDFVTSSGFGEFVSVGGPANRVRPTEASMGIKNTKSVLYSSVIPPEFKENTQKCSRNNASMTLTLEEITYYNGINFDNEIPDDGGIAGILTLYIGSHKCRYMIEERLLEELSVSLFHLECSTEYAERNLKFTDEFLFSDVHAQVVNKTTSKN